MQNQNYCTLTKNAGSFQSFRLFPADLLSDGDRSL
jgi:hypothetical protein